MKSLKFEMVLIFWVAFKCAMNLILRFRVHCMARDEGDLRKLN